MKIFKKIMLSMLITGVTSSAIFGMESFGLSSIEGRLRLLDGSDMVNSVAFRADGKFLALGRKDGAIELWNVEAEKCVYVFFECNERACNGWIQSIAFSPNGKFIAAGSWDGKNGIVRLLDVEAKKCIRVFSSHLPGPVRSVAFSPDSPLLVSTDEVVRLWNIETGECVHAFGYYNEVVTIVVFSPNGRFIASGSWDGKNGIVRLLDVETKKCTHVFSAHKTSVSSISFSPDSSFIASGSWGTIMLFDIEARTGVGFLGLKFWVDSVVFSQDGTKIWAIQGDSRFVAQLSADSDLRLFYKIIGKTMFINPIPREILNKGSGLRITDIELVSTFNPWYTLGDFYIKKFS